MNNFVAFAGALGMAYTLPEYRKLGLMSLCITKLAQMIFEQGAQDEVVAFSVLENTASQAMLKAIGFNDVGRVVWLHYDKKQACQASKL